MNELDKLETKIKVADYAEQNGMVLLKDYGNWIAIGFPADGEVNHKKSIRKLGKGKSDKEIDEHEAKRKIEKNIKSAITETEITHATASTRTR